MTKLCLACLVLLLGAVACATPAKNDHATFRAPSETDFTPVSAVLQARCGSLDCHGQIGRSLRIFGQNGLRSSRDDLTGADAGAPTRPDEDQANYASVVGLEPEIMDRVVSEGGQSPERLTLVRKARGSEHHKGGSAISQGGPADRCIVSWLEGALDADACKQGTDLGFPKWP